MSNITKSEPQTLATELHSIETSVAEHEKRAKELRSKLMESLQAQGVRRVDLKNGDSYILYPRNSLVIKDKMAAQKWFLKNPEARGKMDTAKAMEVALSGKLKWAKVESEEYLRISRAKKQEDENA